jgi:hypothetical protein
VEPYGATFLDGLRAAQVAEAVTEAASSGCQVEIANLPATVQAAQQEAAP